MGYRARGACIDCLRSWSRWSRRVAADVEVDTIGTPPTVEPVMMEADRRAALLLAIARLTPRQARIVRRHYLDGVRLVDLDREARWRVDYSIGMIVRALRRLRRELVDPDKP